MTLQLPDRLRVSSVACPLTDRLSWTFFNSQVEDRVANHLNDWLCLWLQTQHQQRTPKYEHNAPIEFLDDHPRDYNDHWNVFSFNIFDELNQDIKIMQ